MYTSECRRLYTSIESKCIHVYTTLESTCKQVDFAMLYFVDSHQFALIFIFKWFEASSLLVLFSVHRQRWRHTLTFSFLVCQAVFTDIRCLYYCLFTNAFGLVVRCINCLYCFVLDDRFWFTSGICLYYCLFDNQFWLASYDIFISYWMLVNWFSFCCLYHSLFILLHVSQPVWFALVYKCNVLVG